MASSGWKKIIKTKEEGGLGVRDMEGANTALLGKAVWSVIHEPGKLWVQVLTNKYLSTSSVLQVSPKANASPIWNGLLKTRDKLRSGFSFRLGNGETSLWHEDSSGHGNIASTVPYVDIHDANIVLKDLILNGAWNVQDLYTELPANTINLLQQIRPVLDNNGGSDVWTWWPSSTGSYTVKEAYAWLMSQDQQEANNQTWSWIWKTKIPEKITMFLWLTAHNALQVNSHRARCNLAQSAACARCSWGNEDIIHCLRDCPHAHEIWTRLGALSWRGFNTMDVKVWLKSQVTGPNALKFISGIWVNWKWRNNFIF